MRSQLRSGSFLCVFLLAAFLRFLISVDTARKAFGHASKSALESSSDIGTRPCSLELQYCNVDTRMVLLQAQARARLQHTSVF